MAQKRAADTFVFELAQQEPAGSVLYQEHLKLTDKSHIADFAGYLMPLWYSSIAAEHAAVRNAAGIFDCTHMGVLEVKGGDAEAFLDTVATNQIGALAVGAAQYNYILDAAGNVLDDIIVYRRTADNFLVVVNAANEPKIKAYFAALLAGKVPIDASNPRSRLEYRPGIRDMRLTTGGNDCRVDIALQGPASTAVIAALMADKAVAVSVENLKSFHFIEGAVAGIDCLIARTGYTGAKVGFELLVHPDSAVELWRRLLETGKSFDALPCGLGARGSLRIEAGLPLYGHELAGEHNISPFEAGYGWAVKLDKQFFIGKTPIENNAATFNMKVVRVALSGAHGIRPVRPGDGVLDENGVCIGWVTSCAKAGDRQIAIVYAEKEKVTERGTAGIYYIARSESQKSKGRLQCIERGRQAVPDIAGEVISRFEKF